MTGDVDGMDDRQLHDLIEALVREEHRLLDAGGDREGLSQDDHARLGKVTTMLDQAWDLLRQRRAYEEAGLDPDEASTRPAEVVEGYEQ
ncbi:MAG: DUF2630 family protein [Thermoleophilia bacterium]